MISPFASRHWLAIELAALLKEAGYTNGRLAQTSGVDPRKISYALKAQRVTAVDDIRRIVRVLPASAERTAAILHAARAATHRGWWERYRNEMGPRQATYADLETGASISEFSQVLLPGLLQAPRFAEARAAALESTTSKRYVAHRAVEARGLRQRAVAESTSVQYRALLDESIFLREVVAGDVMFDQTNYLIDIALHWRGVEIRVLPFARPAGRALPSTSFSIYRYREPTDFVVVAVETDDMDLIITEPAKTDHYINRFDTLSGHAWPAADTLEFLSQHISKQPRGIRRSA